MIPSAYIRYAFPASFTVAAGLCTLLLLVRCYFLFFNPAPSLALSSGCEEEALFTIWRFIEGQPIYMSFQDIPYASAYFNFGFYFLYGSITKAVLIITGLDMIWLPTIARLITLCFGLLCFEATRRILNLVVPQWGLTLCITAAMLFSFSPLAGFWLITGRPDLGAVAFELCGLYYFLRFIDQSNPRYLISGILFCFLAWTFKQTSVGCITGFCIYLIYLRQWKNLMIACATTWSLYLLSAVIGGKQYIHWVYQSQSELPFYLETTFVLLKSALLKMPFMALLPLTLFLFCWRPARKNDLSTLLVLTFVGVIAFIFSLITSPKLGSADYYFLFSSISLSLAGVFLYEQSEIASRWKPILLILPALLIGLGCISVLAGKRGALHQQAAHFEHLQMKEKLATQMGPAFISARSMNLPWIQPQSPHFVLAYTYPEFTSPGKEASLNHGGVRGLIQDGYFSTIVIHKRDQERFILPDFYEAKEQWAEYTLFVHTARDKESTPQ